MSPVRKAVIPAAGRGTRFYPVTRSVPKELLPIVATPAIDYVIREAIACGIEEIVLVTSREKPELAAHFEANRPAARVTLVYQDRPLGLGHAVHCAREAVGNEPFAVLLPDDIYLAPWPTAELIQLYQQQGKSAVTLLEVPKEEVSRYGVVRPAWERDGVFGIADLVEKPQSSAAPSCLVLPGRYLLTPEVWDVLLHTAPGSGGEIQLTDALRVLAQRGNLIGVRSRGRRFDVGFPAGMIQAQVAFGLADPDCAPALRNALTQLLRE